MNINQEKQFKKLLDDPSIYSVKVSWVGLNHFAGPFQNIEVVKKEDSFIPVQLCPKCNGDGNLLRYCSPNVCSDIPICDICNGDKVIPMIKSE